MKALIVDDDLTLADVLSFTLRRSGYEVIMAHDGQSALERWRSDAPDIIILDINLPRLNGLQVCQRIREESDIPIIMLTVRSDEDDIVKGLEIGADDYIVKPFSPRQLVARAEAVLRRAGSTVVTTALVSVCDVTLDPNRHELRYCDEPVAHLTTLETRLMETLMINRGQVLLTDTLIDQVWGPSGGDRVMLKQLIYRLRRKLEKLPPNVINLETIAGVGYSLSIRS